MLKIVRRHLLLTTLGAAALATTLSSTAWAGPGPDGPPGARKGHRLERFCAEAKCTENQKEELKNAFKQFRIDVKPDHEKIRALHEKLVAEFAKNKPNEKVMKRLYRQIDQIHANIVDRRHDMIMEVHGILNADQRKLAAEKLLHHGPPRGPRGDKPRKGRAK
jgi:Spy/CpxP family protein refolding chaperone